MRRCPAGRVLGRHGAQGGGVRALQTRGRLLDVPAEHGPHPVLGRPLRGARLGEVALLQSGLTCLCAGHLDPRLDLADDAPALRAQLLDLRRRNERNAGPLAQLRDPVVDLVDPAPEGRHLERVCRRGVPREQRHRPRHAPDPEPAEVPGQLHGEQGPVLRAERSIRRRVAAQQRHHALDVGVRQVAVQELMQLGGLGVEPVERREVARLLASAGRGPRPVEQRPYAAPAGRAVRSIGKPDSPPASRSVRSDRSSKDR